MLEGYADDSTPAELKSFLEAHCDFELLALACVGRGDPGAEDRQGALPHLHVRCKHSRSC
jgi:hypothetical protein